MKLKTNDITLCTVKKIEKTTVFVETETGEEGHIVFSEVSAGRIRNIRAFVSPNKKIVCKVLKTSKGHLELSLRRVTAGERDEALEAYQKESTFKKIILSNIEGSQPILDKIQEEQDLSEFIEESRENPKTLENYFSPEDSEKITKILSERKEKEKTVKKTFTLKSESSSGISDIKEILGNEEANIHYLGSSRFSVEYSAPDFKEAEKKILEILERIKTKAKEKSAIIEIKEKK